MKYNVDVYCSILVPRPYVGKVFTWHNLPELALAYLLDGCYYDGDAGMYIRQNSDHSLGYAVTAV